MEKEITTINVNTASREDIQQFMIDNEIYTCAEFGRFVGLSRERIRQVFKERENLNFKEMKREAVKATYVVKPIEKKRWKQITFVDTKHPYYVTRKGEVGRDVIRKPKGVEIVERKLLTPSKNDKGHLRVNLTLKDGRHKTFYLHQIVAHTFLSEPDSNRRLKGVKPLDGDISNCESSNLAWSYFD